jgi:hypothetical protein
MSTSVYSKTSTQAAIQINGIDAVVIDPTGITTGAGKRLAQVVTFQTGTVATGTTTTPHDNTIPQITEGNEFLTFAVTPRNALSTLEINIAVYVSCSVAAFLTAALFQDSTANAIAAGESWPASNVVGTWVVFTHIMTAGTTSITTFKVRVGANNAGTLTFNGIGGVQVFGGINSSRITIKEYLP